MYFFKKKNDLKKKKKEFLFVFVFTGLLPGTIPAMYSPYGRGFPTLAPAGYYYPPGMEILELGQWYPF